jgi:hypothetical protein
MPATSQLDWLIRHGLVRNILFTDGAKYVADAAGAYWLLDEIALAQRFDKKVAAEEFQAWKLTVNPEDTMQSWLIEAAVALSPMLVLISADVIGRVRRREWWSANRAPGGKAESKRGPRRIEAPPG